MQSLSMLGTLVTRNLRGSIKGVRTFQSSASLFSQNIPDDDVETMVTSGHEKTINQVTLLGRTGGDPMKLGSQEHPVVSFFLATHSTYGYSSGKIVQKTEWHRIIIFKPTLMETVMKFLNKGNRVLVQGRLIYGEVKDNDGNVKPSSSIVAEDVIFLASKNV